MTKATHIKVSGVWKPCTSVWVNAGGVWKQDVMPTIRVGGDYKECMEYGYNLGDIGPAGGLIIYKKTAYSDGWRYLEIAPKTWYNGVDDPTGVGWGCPGQLITGIYNTPFMDWEGPSNTQNIVSQCLTEGIPARMANNLSLGGATDWYLPAGGELYNSGGHWSAQYPYTNWPSAYQIITSRRYWMSNQSNTDPENKAYAYAFSEYGTVSTYSKTITSCHTRPIRRF